jgi:hypothetical protein
MRCPQRLLEQTWLLVERCTECQHDEKVLFKPGSSRWTLGMALLSGLDSDEKGTIRKNCANCHAKTEHEAFLTPDGCLRVNDDTR